MTDLPSLRSRVTAGTTLLLLLVFAMTLLGVSAMNSLGDAVQSELLTLRERNVLAQTITHEVVTAVRTGDILAQHPDSAYQARLDSSFAVLGAAGQFYERFDLTPPERQVVDRVTAFARELERRSPGGSDPDEARRSIVADSLLGQVNALLAVQEAAATERDARLERASEQRRKIVWLLFAAALILGVASAVATVRAVVLPL